MSLVHSGSRALETVRSVWWSGNVFSGAVGAGEEWKIMLPLHMNLEPQPHLQSDCVRRELQFE